MSKEASNSFTTIVGLIIAVLAFSTAIFQWMTKEKTNPIPLINIENSPVFNNENNQHNSLQSEEQKKQADKIRELEEKTKTLETELKKRNTETKPHITKPVTPVSINRYSSHLTNGIAYSVYTGTGKGIALRSRPLSRFETDEKNRCQRISQTSNWLRRIDNETYLGKIDEGSKVIYYDTEGTWNYVKDISSGKVGYISAKYAGKSTLR